MSKMNLGWIRGALRGEIQKKFDEADDAEQNGRPDKAANLRRIATEWNKVYEGSRENQE